MVHTTIDSVHRGFGARVQTGDEIQFNDSSFQRPLCSLFSCHRRLRPMTAAIRRDAKRGSRCISALSPTSPPVSGGLLSTGEFLTTSCERSRGVSRSSSGGRSTASELPASCSSFVEHSLQRRIAGSGSSVRSGTPSRARGRSETGARLHGTLRGPAGGN